MIVHGESAVIPSKMDVVLTWLRASVIGRGGGCLLLLLLLLRRQRLLPPTMLLQQQEQQLLSTPAAALSLPSPTVSIRLGIQRYNYKLRRRLLLSVLLRAATTATTKLGPNCYRQHHQQFRTATTNTTAAAATATANTRAKPPPPTPAPAPTLLCKQS